MQREGRKAGLERGEGARGAELGWQVPASWAGRWAVPGGAKTAGEADRGLRRVRGKGRHLSVPGAIGGSRPRCTYRASAGHAPPGELRCPHQAGEDGTGQGRAGQGRAGRRPGQAAPGS